MEEAAKAELDSRKVTYEPLSYPEHGSDRRIKNIASIHDFSKHCKNNNIAHNIEHFLANLSIKECEGNERGITWIEMYILYRIRGNPAPYEHNERKAKSMKTACQQIKEFTRQVRAAVSRTVEEGDKKLFKPHTNQHKNMLEKLAIEASPPALGCDKEHPMSSFVKKMIAVGKQTWQFSSISNAPGAMAQEGGEDTAHHSLSTSLFVYTPVR